MVRSRLVSMALAVTASLVPAFGQTSEPQPDATPESVLFENLPVVEAATLHTQTLQEAPASITIISAEDIRTYGFRTLGEALAAVRGFYVTYDRSYHYAGLRGFSIPGDYNTRFLVMLNGHYLTENIYSSNSFFGQDFDLDMDLVKRIEIVRGPSSALYGSNGIFATINIVTNSPVEAKRLRASTEIASFGERKGMISAGVPLGRGANLLISASVFNNGGRSLFFPEFAGPAADYGRAVGVDSERGYHTFANLIWRNWSFTGYLGAREKQVPTAWYGTVFNDPANRILDARGFFEAAYSRDLSSGRKVRWRIYYDRYRYRARYDNDVDGAIEDWRDLGAGDWVGTQLAYDFAVPHVGVLTVGSELNADLRALQQYYEASPDAVMYLSADHPDISYGFFAQQRCQLSPKWNAYLGVRFDDSRNHRYFVSPRVALVYQATEKSSYKFLVGRAFRNPNAYEEFYADGITQVANRFLHPEQADTYEVSAEHRFTSAISGLVTAYHYRLGDLIQATTLDSGMTQYQNVARSHAGGVEGEFSAKPLGPLETTASLAVERAGFDEDHDAPGNSPRTIGKLRAALPLAKNKLRAAAAFQFLSSRYTLADAVAPAYWLADLTFTTNRLRPDFDLQFGVRNLFNRAYYDPVGVGLPEDRLLQDGRALFVKLVWRTRE